MMCNTLGSWMYNFRVFFNITVCVFIDVTESTYFITENIFIAHHDTIIPNIRPRWLTLFNNNRFKMCLFISL